MDKLWPGSINIVSIYMLHSSWTHKETHKSDTEHSACVQLSF